MKKFDFLRPFVALVAATGLLLLSACSNGLIDPKDPPATSVVTTTVGGMVVDEAGSPMAGVSVSAHGSTTTTNAKGVFQFKSISVPSERACVIARKNGYFTAAHAEWPKQNGVTMVQLTMQKATITTTFSASAGGTASISSSSVVFPANGFVTASGSPYTGTVSVAAAYLTPDNRTSFQQFFAGDAAARRADNSITDLLSYGVLRVHLTGASGEQLQLKSGTTATLRYPVPISLASSQPSTIPLWYFDETIGMWKEEGQATRTGGVYVGSVSHFTDWNLDVPNARRAFVEGTVRCAANRPVPHVWVTIGQVGAMTDENGYFKRRVPAEFAFTIEVDPSRNTGMSSTPFAISGIAENATQTVDVMVSPCPTMLEGTLVDCNDKPIGGYIQVQSSRGISMASTSNGTFRMNVPSGEILKVTAFSIDAQSSSETPVSAIASGDNFNMGTIQACSGAQTTYLDISIGSGNRISATAFVDNGATLAVLGQSTVQFFNVSTGALIRSIDVGNAEPNTYAGSRIMFSADGSVMMVGGPYATTQVFQTATGVRLSKLSDPGSGFLTADGKYVITMDSSGSVSRFSATTGAIEKTFSVPKASSTILGLQGGGTRFVISRFAPTPAYVVWDVATDKEVLTIPLATTREGTGTLSPDGTVVGTLGFVDQKGTLDFFSLVSGAKISTIASPTDTTTYNTMPVLISPSNQQYVSMNYGSAGSGLPMIRNISDGTTAKVLPIPALNSYGTGFSYDDGGTHLAAFFSTQTDGVIRIWKL